MIIGLFSLLNEEKFERNAIIVGVLRRPCWFGGFKVREIGEEWVPGVILYIIFNIF